jgi:hypothetical protein
MRYGTTYHLHLYSEEVQDIRQNHRQAYMFWLHLQAVTFSGVDQWAKSMGAMSRELGCNVATLRRWAVVLESFGLVQRKHGAQAKVEQVRLLLTPPSCEGAQRPADELLKRQGKAARSLEIRDSLKSHRHMLDDYYAEAMKPVFPPTSIADWVSNKKYVLETISELELELESMN